MATKLELTGTGPFEAPKIVDYLGMAYPLSGTSVQLRFVMEGGSELHLPIKSVALDNLIKQLAAAHAKKK